MIDGQTVRVGDTNTAAELAKPAALASAGHSTASVKTGEAALAAYEAFCSTAVHSSSQHPLWIRSWASAHRPDFLVASLSIGGSTAFALALEVSRSGPFRIASFMGGKHANGNFPASDPGFLRKASPSDFGLLFSAIRKARPDIDLILLPRMTPSLEDDRNPLLSLPHRESPNIALELDLAPGFEAICGRSKSLRSKHRSQLRKYEEAGGYRRIEGRTPAEVERLIESFFIQKAVRLSQKGIANVFGDPKVQTFFRSLFQSAREFDRPPFVLQGLEIGEKIRAITGSGRNGTRITCDLVSISDDELSHTRPGEFLFYENIREAVEHGLGVYDFGVGDEPHKRRWCDREIRHFDVHVALTMKGRAFALSSRAGARAKRFIKNNKMLWPLVKRLRANMSSLLR